MEMTGARILMECLKREGVELLFGYPGGQAIDLYHELTNHPELRHILVRLAKHTIDELGPFEEGVQADPPVPSGQI